jgi:hypothetical protein
MNFIEFDFISVVIGYICGFIFAWSLCDMIHGGQHDQ